MTVLENIISKLMSEENLLHTQVYDLLIESGFPDEHFFIKNDGNGVKVLFDSQEALDYFEGDFFYSYLSDSRKFKKTKDGKRFCAVIV